MGGRQRHFCACLAVLAGLAIFCVPALAAENAVRMPVDKSATPDPLGEMMKGKKPAPEKKPEDEPKAGSDAKGAAKKLEPAGVARGEAPRPAEKKEEKKEDRKAEEKKPDAKKPEVVKPAPAKADEKKPDVKKPEEKRAEEKKPAPAKAEATKPTVSKPSAPKLADSAAPKAPAKPRPAPASRPADNATKAAPATPPATAPAAASTVASGKPAADNATAAATPRPAPIPVAPKPAPKPVVDPVAFVMPAGPAGPGTPAAVLPAEGLYVGDVAIEFQHTQIILRAPTTKDVERVTWFYLKDLRRLALDLRGQWRKKGAGTVRYDSGPVKHVVAGEHPDRLRLAVEFREGAVRPEVEPVVVREVGGGVTVTIPLAR